MDSDPDTGTGGPGPVSRVLTATLVESFLPMQLIDLILQYLIRSTYPFMI